MQVQERLQSHIDNLFSDAPQSRAVFDLKEELLANSLDRFGDLQARGMAEEEAYQSVIANIGNVEELVAALPQDPLDPAFREAMETRNSRSALITAIAVGLYILAAIIPTAASIFVRSGMYFYGSLIVALLLCIVPTCMLVYNARRWPKYKKADDSVVESFKQFTADSKRSKSIFRAVSFMMWCIILILYFVISFATFAWYISWVLFLVGACLQAAIVMVYHIKRIK